MKKLLRAVAVALLGVSLSAGMASANSGTVSNTGPNSQNHVTFNGSNSTTVTSHNNGGVLNLNGQFAGSGNAQTNNNTNAGGATSGSVSNANSTSSSVSQNNSGAMAVAVAAAANNSGNNSGSISNTGPDSNNSV